jgi:hypothetical protein
MIFSNYGTVWYLPTCYHGNTNPETGYLSCTIGRTAMIINPSEKGEEDLAA